MSRGDVHVTPVGDLMAHYDRRDCWCKPRIERMEIGDGLVVVHNSADGREFAERDLVAVEGATKH